MTALALVRDNPAALRKVTLFLPDRPASGVEKRLHALAQRYGFYSAIYLHFGHARGAVPARVEASSAVALRRYAGALAKSQTVQDVIAGHKPFAFFRLLGTTPSGRGARQPTAAPTSPPPRPISTSRRCAT